MQMLKFFALFLLIVAVWGRASHPNVTDPDNTCGGNCPSNDCPSCVCGSSTDYVDIASLCAEYGSWSQSCCQCIVTHESSGNANAENYNTNGSYDVGAFQINSVNWPSCNGGKAPCDVSSNLACAKMIWGYYHSFQLWSTCGGCGCC